MWGQQCGSARNIQGLCEPQKCPVPKAQAGEGVAWNRGPGPAQGAPAPSRTMRAQPAEGCPLPHSSALPARKQSQGREEGRGSGGSQREGTLQRETQNNQETCQRSPQGHKAQKKKAEGIGGTVKSPRQEAAPDGRHPPLAYGVTAAMQMSAWLLGQCADS